MKTRTLEGVNLEIDRISFGAFLNSGAWERACAEDDARHIRYDA